MSVSMTINLSILDFKQKIPSSIKNIEKPINLSILDFKLSYANVVSNTSSL